MKIYLVGGAVRDQLLNLPVKERDYVVVGADTAEMLKLGFMQVGKDFPVFLHPDTNEEYALARIERKTKPGYAGFTFDASKDVSLEEDLKRRDLTINAMAVDSETQKIIDPYGGQKDLAAKRIRHVSEAFAEDPVRILRVGRFLARYAPLGFRVAKETFSLMQSMVEKGEVDALVAERVWKEMERALSEPSPEEFFTVLHKSNALGKLLPPLKYDGAGLKNLKAAKEISSKSIVRFAALLANIPEDREDKTDAKIFITNICNRYRIPNAYRELATLTALHHHNALQAATMNAEHLLSLFHHLDIFRRESRFNDFVTACLAIANAKKIKFDQDWLLRCGQVAKSFDVQELISEGYPAQQLAYAIKEKRKEKISLWLKDQH